VGDLLHRGLGLSGGHPQRRGQAIAGTGDFRQLAGVGFLIGVLLVLFQGILQGGRGIRFQNILVAWLLYALMFGPRPRSPSRMPTRVRYGWWTTSPWDRPPWAH